MNQAQEFEWGYRDGVEESVINRRRSRSDLSDTPEPYKEGYILGAVDWSRNTVDREKRLNNYKK